MSKPSVLSSESFYYTVSLLLVGLLLIFGYTKNAGIMYAVLGLSVCFIHRPDILFPVMFISSLSTSIFSLGEGISIGRYMSLIFIVSCVVRLIAEKHHTNGKQMAIAVVLIVFSFFSTIMGPDGGLEIFVSMTMCILVFLLFQEIRGIKLEPLINTLCFSAFLSVIMLWMLSQRYGGLFMTGRFNLDEAANSNRIAMMAEQVGTLCIAYVMFGKQTFLHVLYAGATVGAIMIVLLTGSRSALIALLVSIGLSLFLRIRLSNKNTEKPRIYHNSSDIVLIS